MNVQEYNQLKRVGLINQHFGSLNKKTCVVPDGISSYKTRVLYKEEDLPMDIIWGQVDTPIDINNVIIIFTSNKYGTNRFFKKGNVEVLSDHPCQTVAIKYFLESKGITYKNGLSLTTGGYIQRDVSMLIIQDGTAYEIESSADPTSQFTWSDLQEHPIKPTPSDNVMIEGKEIIMSGFFKERFIS